MLSHVIKQERLRQKLSVLEVSVRARLDPSLISRYEGGNRLPTREHVLRLASALALDEKELLVEWMLEKLGKILAEEKDGTIRSESIRRLVVEPSDTARKPAGNSVLLSQENALTAWKERLRIFEKQNREEHRNWRDRVLLDLCCYLNSGTWKAGDLKQVLLEGKTHSAYSLKDHLLMHQRYEALQQLENDREPDKDRMHGYLQRLADGTRAASLPARKPESLLELATAFLAGMSEGEEKRNAVLLLVLTKTMGFPLLGIPSGAFISRLPAEPASCAAHLGEWLLKGIKSMED